MLGPECIKNGKHSRGKNSVSGVSNEKRGKRES
jgi:hypothetical protein